MKTSKNVEMTMNRSDDIVERIVPGHVPLVSYLEHIERYLFAAKLTKSSERIVDIACGTGYGSYLLACSVRGEVTGIDISSVAIDHANEQYAGNFSPRFIRAGADDIPLTDGYADAVVSFETIEHVANAEDVLSEFNRVLIAGGLMLISSPIYHDSGGADNPFHQVEYEPGKLMDLLTGAGFDISDVYGHIRFSQGPEAGEAKIVNRLRKRLRPLMPSSFMERLTDHRVAWRKGIPFIIATRYRNEPMRFQEWLKDNTTRIRSDLFRIGQNGSFSEFAYIVLVCSKNK
ncbi:MAG: class I SAM-dependent methyltransferase [Nitrospirota bacterium]|nr:MAG: class I SAM-dependent methyltransferase [Nitrospirota bacterium]